MIGATLDSTLVFRLVVTVTVLGVVVTSLEDIVTMSAFDDDGLLSWDIAKTRRRWYVHGPLASLVEYVLQYDHFRYVLFVRLLVALVTGTVVVFETGQFLLPSLLAVLLVSTIAITIRSSSGLDGSHQLNVLLFASLVVYSLSPIESLAREICLAFIAVQAVWAYVSAGAHKAIASEWRNGEALRKTMSTSSYGNDRLYYLFRDYPLVSRLSSVGIIVFECSFVLVLFVDANAALFFLGAGVVFHGLNAVFMGLNSFFFSFVATYPAILYVSLSLSRTVL